MVSFILFFAIFHLFTVHHYMFKKFPLQFHLQSFAVSSMFELSHLLFLRSITLLHFGLSYLLCNLFCNEIRTRVASTGSGWMRALYPLDHGNPLELCIPTLVSICHPGVHLSSKCPFVLQGWDIPDSTITFFSSSGVFHWKNTRLH